MNLPHGAVFPAPHSHLRKGQKQGWDEHFGSKSRGTWAACGGVSGSNCGQSPPSSQMMSQLSCACVMGLFIFFTQPHTPQDGVRGGRTVTGEMCSEIPPHPDLTQRGRQSPHLDPQALYDLPPSHLPIFTSSLSPQPEGPPPCFSSSPGTVLPQDLGTDSSLYLGSALPPCTCVLP